MKWLVALLMLSACASAPPEPPLLILPPPLVRSDYHEGYFAHVSVMVVGEVDCDVSLLHDDGTSQGLGVSPIVSRRLSRSNGAGELVVRCPNRREYSARLSYARGDYLKLIVKPDQLTPSVEE